MGAHRHGHDQLTGGRHLGPRRDPAPTPRQLEVLRSRFRHGSRKEGAAALGISDMTARGHMEQLCDRLGVENAEEAAYVLWLRELWGDP